MISIELFFNSSAVSKFKLTDLEGLSIKLNDLEVFFNIKLNNLKVLYLEKNNQQVLHKPEALYIKKINPEVLCLKSSVFQEELSRMFLSQEKII